MLPSSIKYGCLVTVIALLAGCGMRGGAVLTEPVGEEVAFPREAVARYERGLAEMQAGNDDRAIAIFAGLSEDYPDYAGPLVNLGILHRRNDRPVAANAILVRALSSCTDCAAAFNQLGILQRQQGFFDEAEESYLNAIDADPKYALAYLNLGVLYDLYQRRLPLALEYYERYVEITQDEQSKAQVMKWIADLKRRVAAPERTAGTGASS